MTWPISSGWLGALRHRPLAAPVARAAALRPGYRTHAMDLGAAAQAEPLVRLDQQGIAGQNHYAHPHNPPYHQAIPGAVPHLWLRQEVAARLVRINARLAKYGLELWVYDAWRPLAVQNYFHDTWMPAQILAEQPDIGPEALAAEVEAYWARGAPGELPDPTSPPPHSTGAAVDLTLRRIGGDTLFMGTIFDDVSAASNTDHFEGARPRDFSALEARDNRRTLYWLMAEAGFANNPTEWWHYSLGDQMWARLSGAPCAYYTAATPPPA